VNADSPDTFHDYEQRLDANYERVGESSEALVARKADRMLRLLKRWGCSRPARFLDVGCGIGLAERALARSDDAATTLGVDTCQDSIRVARASAIERAEFVPGSGLALPVDDGSVDVCFTFCTLHHVPPSDRPAFLKEMRRVTRRGGWIFVAEHNRLNPATRYFTNICEFDRGCTFLSAAEVKRLMSAAGIQNCRTRYLLFFPSRLRGLVGLEKWLGWCPLGAQYLVGGTRGD